jgi:hypothetical protein
MGSTDFPRGPLLGPLTDPVVIPDGDTFVVRARVSFAEAADLARKAIVERTLRPADLGDPARDVPRLVWTPFWRIDAGVDTFHLGLSGVRVGGVPLPTGGNRHRDAVLFVCARRAFPYELALPSFLSGVVSDHEPLEVDLAELESLGNFTPVGGELLEADVPREAAERDALTLLTRAISPNSALYVDTKRRVKSALFVRVPLYFVRYAYEGEARSRPGEEYYVVLSGRTGKVVSAHHPSAVRATAARIRRFLTFK